MSIDVFSIHCDVLEGAKLAGFKGVEGLNRPFEMDVFFTVPVGTDVKSAVGARATLTADRADDRGPMCWHGVFARLRLLHETAERALYRAALVPKLWLLRQYVRNYVHTRKKVDVFIGDTLKDGGLTGADFRFHINGGAYPQEEFVCQYRESHLDFVHRWCEREGLYYYFEHPAGEGESERLVIVDDKAQHHPLLGKGKVRYSPGAGQDTSAGECFHELQADFDLLPATVMISDYNYSNPSAPLSGEKAVSGAGQGLIREYGYRVFNEGEAARLAGVKAQSMGCREIVLTASGNALGMRAGYTFEVEDAPADLPAKYLAIEVRHAGTVSGASTLMKRYTGLDAAETYRVDVVAIPSNVQFRAPQATAWPRIYGFENGSVDGPAESQYAQIDDQGRYLVRFKFDASALPDGSTSTYLRMMQPHGGTTEGWHFPLRKGTEVMVSFQGGDPDRPVIAGVVPNAVQPSNVTSRNHTQNVLRTGGGNFVVMEDQAGQEFIDMGTPLAKTRQFLGKREFVQVMAPPGDDTGSPTEELIEATYHVTTLGNAVFSVGEAWYQSVGANYYVEVGGHSTVHHGASSTFIVDGVSNEFYKSARNTTIAGAYAQHAKATMTHDVDGLLTQNAKAGGSQTVTGNWTQTVTGKNDDVYGTWVTNVGKTWSAVVQGNVSITSAGGDVTISSPNNINLVAPKVTSTAAGDWITMTGKSLQLFGSANAIGGQKLDVAGIAIAISNYNVGLSGLKVDMTAAQIAHTGKDVTSAVLQSATTAVQDVKAGITNVKTGIGNYVAGLFKLG